MLGDLATGVLPLNHDALQAYPARRTVAYLRDLLMTCALLPAVDRCLLHVETWMRHRVAGLPDTAVGRLLRQYAAWWQLHRLRRRAANGPLS